MAKSASSHTKRSGGSPVFTGILIGLIVGAILAVGVALWVADSTAFRPGSPQQAPVKPAVTAPAVPETAPSFDFYKVLPSDAPSELPSAPAVTAPVTLYYLQAGAFLNPDDADNLKAQLAMLGVETVIQTGDVAGKGVFHRVRVGPLRAMDDVNRTRSLLEQNNIPTTLVKETPPSQEKS